jgi:cytochrome b561
VTGPATRYRAPAKLLHWLTALAIFCVVPLGLAMTLANPGPEQNRLYDLHRSFGAVVLMLTALRLLWRLYAPAPPMVPGLPPWQERAARYTHYALYVLLFAVPLLGWTGTSAFGAQIVVFDLFTLPALVEKNRELAEILLPTHVIMALTLCFLLIGHIGAALYHHFIRKDETLRRMLPQSGG